MSSAAAPSTPLRIALLAPLWTRIPPATYGGIELLLKLLIEDLTARGHDVTLFASGDCVTSAKLRAVPEANLYELCARGDAYMHEYYVNALMADVLRSAGEFDIIHSHLAPGWLPFAGVSPTPMLFTLHTNLHRDDEWVFRRYPNLPACGISRDQMKGVSLAAGREFPVVYNGCDFAAYEPSLEPGEYLAFLGRMSPAKNPAGAIRIAKACKLPIVLAGQPQNAAEEQYFAAEVKPLIDGKSVRWIGGVNHHQKNELLRKASALLFPIQWDEPFGLVMIEAMACGTPVVAHRRGSVSEVVDDGITGYHAGSLDALDDLVPHALALDRAQVRAHAQSRFGHQQMVTDYLALYYSLIAERAG